MASVKDGKVHSCPSCIRFRKIKDILTRIERQEDREVILALLDDAGRAEADLELDEIILSEYRRRHGGIGLTEALNAQIVHESDES